MKPLTHNIVFIVAAWMFLCASAVTAVSVAVGTDVCENVVNVESSRDNLEVTDRDKTGTLRLGNFAIVSQVNKKEAFTKKASLATEREGFEPSVRV